MPGAAPSPPLQPGDIRRGATAAVPGAGLPGIIGPLLFATTGISFWFIIGFPFGHHNESYSWAAHLNSIGLWEALTEKFPSVNGLRPLGTGLAWVLYHGSGGSVAPQQLCNLALALLSWWILVLAASERRLTSVLACVCGGVFFSGYVYLFHIHGVFYGFAMMWVAAAAWASFRELTTRMLLILAAGAAIAALAHPHALILLVAFACAAPLDHPGLRRPAGAITVVTVAIVAMALMMLLVPAAVVLGVTDRGLGLLTTFRTVELHPLMSATALALTVWTTAGVRGSSAARALVALAALATGGGMLLAGFPALPAWIGAALIKAVSRGRWSIAAMLAASVSFAWISPTGSPTYTVIMLMLATIVAAADAPAAERRLARVPSWAFAAAAVIALVPAFAIQSGARVPVLTAVAWPLLAEKERTHQLEVALEWFLRSPYRTSGLGFAEDAPFPVHSGEPMDRRRRPPAKNQNLQDYLTAVRGEPTGGAWLLMSFGGEPGAHGEAVLTIPGRYAGPAVVYLPGDPAQHGGTPPPGPG